MITNCRFQAFFCFFILLFISFSTLAQSQLDQYNVVWTSQSKNAGESMPCGGGDIGMNVWVENGDLLIYLSRSGAFDENNMFPKMGRIRLHLSPNPFDNTGQFKQELKLRDGCIEITAGNKKQEVKLIVWADVFRPVAHIDVASSTLLQATASYESWRVKDRIYAAAEQAATSYKWMQGIAVTDYKDSILFSGKDVLFYHRNKDNVSAFDYTVHEQGLDSIKNSLWNPLHNMTYGGRLSGENMVPSGTDTGTYVNTPFAAWHLQTKKATRKLSVTMYVNIDTANSISSWEKNLQNIITSAQRLQKSAQQKSLEWWNQFWQRSYIFINPENNNDTASLRWQAARNYQLFRYMLGCNAYGSYPTKFNGGLFTYDPVFTRQDLPFTPDFRLWGGGTFTAQNQRLVYWPMLKSGDADMMKPQFDFYLHALRNAELITQYYWHHKGACFNEQIENFGLPEAFEYTQQRPESFDKGLLYNSWIDYTWDTVLEFCLMILQSHQYTGADISQYMPLIKSSLLFFDEHYQQEQAKRSTKQLDADGHLVIYPGSAAETYKITYNSVTTVAGLTAVLDQFLKLPDSLFGEEGKTYWQNMLGRIPPLSFREMQGHVTIAPAVVWERINNEEIPQLYPVFPYGLYGVGKPGLDTAINTWKYDTEAAKYKGYVGWKQDAIFCARMGLTDEAADLTLKKLKNSGRRFPSFWGPGFDWTPDHNWGGSGMIALQEMLMQTDDKAIRLLPAWPKDWNGIFKLNAPYQTTVEGKIANGVVRDLKITPASRMKDVIIMNK